MRPLLLGLSLAALALGTGCSSDSPTGPSGGPITLGAAVTIAGAEGSQKFFTVVVPAGAAGLRVRLSGGSGDADLYLRYGADPTEFAYDCASAAFGGDEECFMPAATAGTWHIAVLGFEAYSGVSLLAETASGPTATALTSGVGVAVAGTGESSRFFTISVPAGATALNVTTSGGTGDVDIDVRFGYESSHPKNCSSALTGNSESCSIDAPPSGLWYIRLSGYEAYAGATLTATVTMAATLQSSEVRVGAPRPTRATPGSAGEPKWR